jgi:hypothetical protein
MRDTTRTAYPCAYSEHVQACRTREGMTAAAFSCCVFLIDDEDVSARLLALILQLRSEDAPA